MRGRKPVPTELHRLRGNPGKRRLNDAEPKPRGGMPRCPEHLDAAAKKEWKRVAPTLHACGCLTLADRAALAAYCQAYSRVAKLEAKVQQLGEVLPEIDMETRRPTGKLYPSPYFAALNKALRTMHQFASEFGMTPSARTRIKVEAPAKEEDPLEAMMRDGGSIN